MADGEIPDQDPWGAPKLTKAVRMLQNQYASDLPIWRSLWQAVGRNADLLDQHSKMLEKMKLGGDLLQVEVAKTTTLQQVMQSVTENE